MWLKTLKIKLLMRSQHSSQQLSCFVLFLAFGMVICGCEQYKVLLCSVRPHYAVLVSFISKDTDLSTQSASKASAKLWCKCLDSSRDRVLALHSRVD
uniref:Uncharacterized protein n=1 Tax=Aegilops tauschii subsp. strangulata TaxID=200361 RepID=A0A453Q706_AEGTS